MVIAAIAILAYRELYPPQDSYSQTPFGLNSAVASTNVTIVYNTFVPGAVKINSGNEVTWYNNDGQIHEISSVPSSSTQWSSGTIGAGQYFTKTFNTPGTYWYYDSISGIRGVVYVQ